MLPYKDDYTQFFAKCQFFLQEKIPESLHMQKPRYFQNKAVLIFVSAKQRARQFNPASASNPDWLL